MRCSVLIALLLLTSGIMGMVVSSFNGRIEVIILLIVPVLILRGAIPILSLLSVVIGASLLVYIAIKRYLYNMGPMKRTPRGSKDMEQYGGVLFIGPFPILFGNMVRYPKWHITGLVIMIITVLGMIAILMLLAMTPPWAG
ncbi:MAG: DUF131 domain-containing protein [Candidatus Thermoplasmatota archaeon]|nr:DUF131 domain-containing protein [Candidatus Thermoplasmatota archaeon]